MPLCLAVDHQDFYDIAKGHTQCSRLVQTAHTALFSHVKTLVTDLGEKKAHYENAAQDVTGYFEVAYKNVTAKLRPVEALLQASDVDLKQFQQDVFESKVAVPCKQVGQLMTLADFLLYEKDAQKLENKNEVDKFLVNVNFKKAVILGLLKTAGDAVKEYAAAVKGVDKMKENEAKAQTTPSKGGRPKKQSNIDKVGIMELHDGMCKPFQVLQEQDQNSNVNVSLPFAIHGSEASKALFKPSHAVTQENQRRFLPAFENAAVRKTAGRACRALYDESMHERCASHLTKPLGDKCFSLKELHDAGKLLLYKACTPNHTVMEKGLWSVGFDFENLASIRTLFTGTRFVCMLDAKAFSQWVVQEKLTEKSKSLSAGFAVHFFQTITKEQLSSLTAATADVFFAGRSGHMTWSTRQPGGW